MSLNARYWRRRAKRMSRASRRSNGPVKTSRLTSKAVAGARLVRTPPGTTSAVGASASRAGPVPPPASSGTVTIRSGRPTARDELAGELAVRVRPLVRRVVGRDGLGGQAGVRELHGPRDDRVEHLVAEVVDDACDDLARVQRPAVVHRREDAIDLQPRVEPIGDLLDRLHEQRYPAHREELALERDDDAVCRRQCVDRQESQRRLAVDEHDVVVVEDGAQDTREDLLAGDLTDELDLRGRQVDVRGEDVEIVDLAPLDDGIDVVAALGEQVVDGDVELLGGDAQADRQRTLRVEVDEQDTPAHLREGGAEVDRRRRLPDAALLVAHGDDAGGSVRGQRCRFGEVGEWPAGRAHLSGGEDLERRVGIQLSLPGCWWCSAVSLALIGTDPISGPGGGSGRTPRAVAAPSPGCTPASSSPMRGRAAPGRPGRRHRLRAGGWRRSDAVCAARGGLPGEPAQQPPGAPTRRSAATTCRRAR